MKPLSRISRDDDILKVKETGRKGENRFQRSRVTLKTKQGGGQRGPLNSGAVSMTTHAPVHMLSSAWPPCLFRYKEFLGDLALRTSNV